MTDIKTVFYNTIGLMQWSDVIDILLMTLVLYYVFTLLKDTSAGQVVKAIVIILIATQVTSWLKLYVTNYVFSTIIQIGAIALVVVFQPELRKVLTRLGSSRARELFAIDRESGSNRFESYLAIIL